MKENYMSAGYFPYVLVVTSELHENVALSYLAL